MLPSRRARLLPLLCLMLTACGRCGGGDVSVEDPDPPSLALVLHVPSDTLAIGHSGDLTQALDGYVGARDQLSIITTDLGLLETDLTNTLGLDLRRPETLREAGVDLERGVLGFGLQGEPVVLVATSDSARFEARLTSVLTSQPVALDATPERVTLESGELILYRRQGAETVIAAALIRADHVAIWPNEPQDASASAATLLAVAPGTSLGTADAFRASWSQRQAETPMCAWVASDTTEGAEGAGADMQQGLEDAAAGFAELLGVQPQGLLACARLDGDGLGAVFVLNTEGDVLGEFSAPAAPPLFSELVDENTQAVLRWTVPPSLVFDVATRLGGDELTAVYAPYEQDLGISFDTVVDQALGSRGALLITRTRALTLRRATMQNAPGDWAGGLGLVAVIELKQRDLTERLLRSIAANMGDGATVFEEGDRVIVEFNNSESDIGNLVLTDERLFIIPGRQRADLLTQITTGEGAALDSLRGDGSQALMTGNDVNGLYLDLARIIDGPIGQLGTARLPDEAKRAIGLFDHALIDVAFDETRVHGSLNLRFLPPETP